MVKIVKNRKCPLCSNKKVNFLNLVNDIDVVRCTECKMVFADVGNEEIEDKNIYNEASFYKYIANEPVYSLAYYDILLDKIKKSLKNEDIKILEFGCGPGFFLRRAKIKGINAQGCDISSYSKLAKDKFDLDITIGNIMDSDIKDSEFDVIISHATHEHLSRMYELSEKLYQLLKPGGLYIISGVPNYNTIPIKLFRNFFKNNPPSHVNFFEKRSLKRFYEKLNLKPFFVRTYGMSTWMWYILMRVKQNLRNNKQPGVPENIQVNDIKIKEHEINRLHKIIAKIYINSHIPGMGRNLEIWGRKEI